MLRASSSFAKGALLLSRLLVLSHKAFTLSTGSSIPSVGVVFDEMVKKPLHSFF